MPTIATKGRTQISFKDWGTGQPIVFRHGRCIKACSETDQTDDLRKLTAPTLFIHGGDDQIVPIGAAAQTAVKIAPKAQLKVYPG